MRVIDDMLPPPTKKLKDDAAAVEAPALSQFGPPQAPEFAAMHKRHRQKLVARLVDLGETSSIVVLRGGGEQTRDETDHEYIFRQESSFQYLFGVREPDCWASIKVPSGETTLYIPKLPQDYATWMGTILPPSHYKEQYEVDNVRYIDDVEADVGASRVLLNRGYNTDGKAWSVPACEGVAWLTKKQKEGQVLDTSALLYDAIVHCRVIKTGAEVEVMQRANSISSQAHLEVMRRVKSGMGEHQLESMFKHWCYFHGGCRHAAYTSICGCGPNSSVLHYGHAGAPNDRIIRDGDMLLLDMGAEYHCYASDITCSFPATGRFTEDQKSIFEAVAHMQSAVMEAMKPGVQWVAMHELSYRVALEHLLTMGIVQGDLEKMMEANLAATFMPHGLGHLIGLDTHDVGGYATGVERDKRAGYSNLRCNRPLEVGMVITAEPGLYFIDHLLDQALADPTLAAFLVKDRLASFRGFGGVRLEDCIVIVEGGIRNLTKCPRTVAQVEAVMDGRITRVDQLV